MERVKELGFFEAVLQVLRKTFVYNGRARRKEFWSWSLFVAIVAMVLSIGLSVAMIAWPESILWMTALLYVFSFVIFFPSLSVTIRRLHDVGRSGWWYGGYCIGSFVVGVIVLLFFVIAIAQGVSDPDNMDVASIVGGSVILMIYGLAAFLYSMVLLVWSFTEGTRGPNKYGEDSKYEVIEEEKDVLA